MSKAHFVLIAIVLINAFAFITYAYDKYKAKKNGGRVSENFLLVLAFLGGSVGAWSAMYFFHHKTKHLKFVLGIPILFLLHLVIAFYFLKIKY